MFSPPEWGLCSDHNALVNSHYMDLHDIQVLDRRTLPAEYFMNIVFHLRSESKETTHTLMLNSDHVIKAVEHLTDESELERDDRELIANALRVLSERTKAYAKASD